VPNRRFAQVSAAHRGENGCGQDESLLSGNNTCRPSPYHQERRESPSPALLSSTRISSSRITNRNLNARKLPNFQGRGASLLSSTPTLETISEKRKALEAQLKALQEQEQKLIEAKALKLTPCYDGMGVLIKKEGNQMALLLEDAQELVEKLTDLLTKPQL
jgi:hypothetical protein